MTGGPEEGSRGLKGGRRAASRGLSCAAPVYHLMCCNLRGSRSNHISFSAGRRLCWEMRLLALASLCVWGREDRRQTTLALALCRNFLALSHTKALLRLRRSLRLRQRLRSRSSRRRSSRLSLTRKQTKAAACACLMRLLSLQAWKLLGREREREKERERAGDRRPPTEGTCSRRGLSEVRRPCASVCALFT